MRDTPLHDAICDAYIAHITFDDPADDGSDFRAAMARVIDLRRVWWVSDHAITYAPHASEAEVHLFLHRWNTDPEFRDEYERDTAALRHLHQTLIEAIRADTDAHPTAIH